MKILYAVQGTGNGHICRAQDIIPLLQKYVEVDVLVSGTQADIDLPCAVKFRLSGLSFVFGKRGGVDIWKSFSDAKLKTLVKEIRTIPVEDYDLVINDFEPVTAWACQLKKVPLVGLSHQSALLMNGVPLPKFNDWIGWLLLKYYAPQRNAFGFHFRKYNSKINTPVIREMVRSQKPVNHKHYTVYLPAYKDQKLIKILGKVDGVKWEVFSKHNKVPKAVGNVMVRPINNEAFVASMASSEGVLCGAGFETPAEALYLRKKLMVVPMQKQYEQHINAAALEEMGVPVLPKLKSRYLFEIINWVHSNQKVLVDFPDETEKIVVRLLRSVGVAIPLAQMENEGFNNA